VQRVTQNPARRFQLSKRGTIKSGNFADLVLFDPNIVNDVSSFEDPKQPPVGIPFVIVNGQVAVDHGHCSGVLAGEAIL
jgi:N-acyl-D-amino-acid deacylase